MKGKETEDKNMTTGVTRTIKILEVLSKAGPINLENLSKETELPKATLLRFLSTLINLGYVCRDDADCYSLTLMMFSISSRALNKIDLISKSRPVAKALCKDLGETVHMGILEENSAVYVLKEDSSYPIRMHSRVGKVIPLYCTAIGKIFLSEMKEEAFAKYLKEVKLRPFTINTIKSEEALRANLSRAKENGYAMDNEEHEDNIICIAAPVYDYTNHVVAAFSVSWPAFRFDHEAMDEVAEKIKRAAQQLSEIMGHYPVD